MMRAEQAWQAALGQLQLEMNKANFDTWVRDAELVSYEDGEFIIGVKDAYTRDWLTERMTSTVTRILTGNINRTVQVRFIVWQPILETETQAFSETDSRHHVVPVFPATPKTNRNSSLQNRYTFDSFVVGP